jgi:hypothetical protein
MWLSVDDYFFKDAWKTGFNGLHDSSEVDVGRDSGIMRTGVGRRHIKFVDRYLR